MSENEPKPSIKSPFAQTSATLPESGSSGKGKVGFWVLFIVVVSLIISAAGYLGKKHLDDPYRTLETFPVDKYLLDYRSLSGAKFKATLRVEADLGWNEHTGKLMCFSTPGESRYFVVLIPPKFATTPFTKGQTYRAEIEVREGGLIYANSCEKN